MSSFWGTLYYDGVRFNNSTGSILNNIITTNSTGHGIVAENAANVTIKENVITKTNVSRCGVGIYFGGGATGIAALNDIYHWDWGICAIWSSSPSSYYKYNLGKNNRIRNCNTGLMVYRLSYPILGTPPPSDYMWNSIYNNTYNAKVGTSYPTYESGLNAYGNWWGAYPPNTSLFLVGQASWFNYGNYLQFDPWVGPILETDNITLSVNSDLNSILYGIQLRLDNKYSEAKDYFISYSRKNPTKQAAYIELYNCYNQETAADLIKFFSSLPPKASKDYKLLLSYLHLKNGNVKEAKEVNNTIIAEEPNTELATKAKLNNAYITLYNENNISEAIIIFNEVLNKTELSTPVELSLVHNAIETYGMTYGMEVKSLSTLPYFESPEEELKKQNVLELPDHYELLGNYPNPFNPSTTISYALPYQSSVELIIYDLMGSEVKSFNVTSQPTGFNRLVWDGRNENGNFVTSGVYFYKISIKSLENNEKFVKTAKLMMLK